MDVNHHLNCKRVQGGKMYMGWGRCTGKKKNILKLLPNHQDERVNIYASNITNLLTKISNSDLHSLTRAKFL
jgi:hypothetical protein